MSFMEGEMLYITKGGSRFGWLEREPFYQISLNGEELPLQAGRPSKELLLHQIVYRRRPDRRVVIHTYSPYTVWQS